MYKKNMCVRGLGTYSQMLKLRKKQRLGDMNFDVLSGATKPTIA